MKAVRALHVATKPEAAVAEVDKPARSQPGDVLVRVLAVGLDGTDREILAGGYGQPPAGETDLTIGHESMGVVVEAGADSALAPGDLVTALVRRPCRNPACVNCRNGRQDFCETGEYVERGIKGRDGYLSEYYVEDAAYLVKIPAACLEYGMLAEPQSIVEKVWDQVQRVQQRLVWEPKTALVLGSGPLGILAAMTCRCLGLETHVWSKSPASGAQAEFVRACGAVYREAGTAVATSAGRTGTTAPGGDATVRANAASGSGPGAGGAAAAQPKSAGQAGAAAGQAVAERGAAAEQVQHGAGTSAAAAATGGVAAAAAQADAAAETLTEYAASLGKPIDLIFECTGYSPLAFEAITVLGPNGVLALLGVTPGKKSIQVPSDAINQELVLENKCVLGSVNASRKDFETGLYRLQQMEEKFPGLLGRFITQRMTMEQVPQVDFSSIEIKAVVDVVPREKWRELVNVQEGAEEGASRDVQYSFSV
ncbi:glucose 1-dehydrogenase [Paenibacillus hamazuiensis]|uniref:glucose 1-dehydrogenase n=1 Tax=Paenibacillus hamazuiensis TaxID=2936508 RepID=UPI00200EF287|nr:glucose 1-dehydrogenase [Paenibacillus hamazuiensis]